MGSQLGGDSVDTVALSVESTEILPSISRVGAVFISAAALDPLAGVTTLIMKGKADTGRRGGTIVEGVRGFSGDAISGADAAAAVGGGEEGAFAAAPHSETTGTNPHCGQSMSPANTPVLAGALFEVPVTRDKERDCIGTTDSAAVAVASTAATCAKFLRTR